MSYFASASKAILLVLLFVLVTIAQNIRVQLGKHVAPIPKVCEGVVPASVEGDIDIPALVKEATCKGAGDMLTEFTYTLDNARRERNKKGEIKDEKTTYEVYLPTLKGGTSARGILLATSHNGVPVDPKELDKQRMQAGEKLGKEEEKIAQKNVPAADSKTSKIKGMRPLGSYARMTMNTGTLGFGKGTARLEIDDFLNFCDLELDRHEQVEGRDEFVFSFSPRADAKFDEGTKYISQLHGEIWIDKQDRIVTKLVGWPKNPGPLSAAATKPFGEKAPPVFAEMMRLPEGIWLPHISRLNAADYPWLFDRFSIDSMLTYSDYKRFVTEAKQEK